MRCHLNAERIRRTAVNLGVTGACLVWSIPLLAQEPKPRATLQGHTKSVDYLAFSPDGKTLASGGDDKSIKLWNVATGENTATLTEKRPYLWRTVAFSPDGKTLATGGWFRKIKLWNVATLKGTIILDQMMQSPPPMVVFSPDGKTLASGGRCNSEIKLFDMAAGKNSATLITQDGPNAWGIEAMAFTADGKTLVSVGLHDGINLWDVATGKKKTATLKTADKERIAKLIRDLGSAEPLVRETAAKELEAIGPLAIDMLDQANENQDAEFSKRVAKLVKLLKAKTVRYQLDYAAAFSPDGKTLATGSPGKSIKLWEVASSKEQAALKGHATDVCSLVFSPDGKTLASGSGDGTIKLWNLATGKEFATFQGHTDNVRCLAFSQDGKTLASGGADTTIKLWDVATGK